MRALVCELSVPRQVVTSLLGRIDKRFFFGPFSPATLRELPEPELPAPDWVTIRTRLCGICGSDYKQMFLNGSMDNPMTAVISFPQVLGHEVVGTIERVGPAVRTRRVGERVRLNPWLSWAPRGIQPPCPECAAGQYSICRDFARGILPPGIHTGNSSKATGGFAPLVPAHESMCIPIPEGVSDEQAVLADPFSVSLHAILKRPPAPGATALVYGCGTLGLLAIAILRALYPATRVLAVARFAHQRALAERFGAAIVLPHEPARDIVERVAAETGANLMTPWYGLPWLHGGGVDVVYDTVGLPGTVEVGLRIAAARGAIARAPHGRPRADGRGGRRAGGGRGGRGAGGVGRGGRGGAPRHRRTPAPFAGASSPCDALRRMADRRELATGIVKRLREAGHEAYFAGGCVRDRLLGREPLDFDVATSAPPEAVQTLFRRTVPVGAQFGVILVVEDGVPFEVATFRSDDAYVDGRRPTGVHFGSARADAERRDFTINGLFLDPLGGEVVDFVGGLADLRAGIIRAIGDARARIAEDRLRMLRG